MMSYINCFKKNQLFQNIIFIVEDDKGLNYKDKENFSMKSGENK